MSEKPNKKHEKIYKTSKSCYKIYYKGKYICSCRTYEQAHYTREELSKKNWDTTQLPRIQKEYPRYYTQLLFFYHHIHYHKRTKNWLILIPKSKSASHKTEHIRYKKLEDALFERDFLVNHDWDYDLLVETINDEHNPYYNMTLPPYPERRIRNIQDKKTHIKELSQIKDLILEDPDISVSAMAKKMTCAPQTIRNWLNKYGLTYLDFKTLVLNNENPIGQLQLKEKIYKPNLTPSKPNFKHYVSHHNRSKTRPYVIVNPNRESFGWYPTREIAEKVAKELKKHNWNRNKLQSIQKKYDVLPRQKNRNFVYPHGKKYTVRKQIKNKKIGFGTYKTQEIAERIRDKLMECNWDKNQLFDIQCQVANEFGGELH